MWQDYVYGNNIMLSKCCHFVVMATSRFQNLSTDDFAIEDHFWHQTQYTYTSVVRFDACTSGQWSLLLTWFNFYPNMHK